MYRGHAILENRSGMEIAFGAWKGSMEGRGFARLSMTLGWKALAAFLRNVGNGPASR